MPSIAATASACASAVASVGAANLDFKNELKDFEVAAGIGFLQIPGTYLTFE
jgi:hypothetical protein